ncbi:MAG: response regulator [Candidatus Limivivens sp.]|nr:response regulator [Candidatus Limivivens sp.]
MYRLVIADDEKRIRMALKNIVDWEELGFEVTELFADGQEVIEYLDYVMPDVILTDIKMSHVSGLEVAKYVFEHRLPCKVVLVSGYQEFELAVQGIKYGAEDYLLKPTDVEKLEETFRKIRKQLDETKERLRKSKAEKERMEEAIPLLEERFFSDLVMGVVESEEYIRSCMEILYPEMEIEQSKCFLADIYIEGYERFMEEVWEYSYDQLEVNLTNFLRIYKEGYSFHIVYKSENLVEVVGIRTEKAEEESACAQVMERLLQELEQYFRFQAGYQIRKEYENVFQLGKMREDFWEKEEDEQVLSQYLQEQKKLVMSNITMGNIVTAQKLCRNILEELKHVPVMTRNNWMIDMLSTMNMVIQEVNEKLAQSLQSYFNYSSVLAITNPEDMAAYVDRIFDRIRMAEEKKEYYDTGSLIAKAKAYIKDNIYKDISQEETANYLYICPSYLSRMFKKQTGESFLQYVTRVKMEKAIELLRDPQYKIYQVREILGYKTPRYFSRLFRNYTGMNPSEYRGKVLHIGGEFDEG